MSVYHELRVRRSSSNGDGGGVATTLVALTPTYTTLPPGSLLWNRQPISTALDESARRREQPPGGARPDEPDLEDLEKGAFCAEVGRRLLLSEYLFHEWVLRRVEKVAFANERRISRHISVELRVPEDAPVVLDDQGEPHWLIPLSVMRRRTLVNLDLRDEDNRSVSMLGLRFTQRLDEALLRAAALLAVPATTKAVPARLLGFIHHVVSGDWDTVKQAEDELERTRQEEELEAYFDDPLFEATLGRMWHNFTLYVTLPVEKGRHRLLRMSFDEPVDWGYQMGTLTPEPPKAGQQVDYRPFGHRLSWYKKLFALLGWSATRMRFQVPSAENCASYHFEFTSPPGVRVSRARLVAGRPNIAAKRKNDRKVSVDGVDAPGELVGLHAVEIPNGSLCRTQVELRIPARGWLSTLFFISLAIVSVTAVLTWYLDLNWPNKTAQAQSLFLSLVALSAGAATYVVHHDSREVAARMLSWLRGAGLIVISAPVIMGIMLLVLQPRVTPADADQVIGYFWALVAVAATACAVVLVALCATGVAEWRHALLSPWDMAHIADGGRKESRPLVPSFVDRYDYRRLVQLMRMSKPAIGVASAEGWHETYAWDAAKQDDAVRKLRGPQGPPRNVTGCTCDQVANDHLPTG